MASLPLQLSLENDSVRSGPGKPNYCGVQNYSVSGFIIFELFTVIFFQDWAGWGIFTVDPGNPQRTKGDSQHSEARPELHSRTGPFSDDLGNNFELYSKESSVHELFTGAFRNKSSMRIVLVFSSKDTRIHRNGRNS